MRKWQTALRFIGIGWFIVLSVVGGTLGGLWLDSKWGSSPVFIIIGLFTGLIVAFYGVYKMVLFILNNDKGKGNS